MTLADLYIHLFTFPLVLMVIFGVFDIIKWIVIGRFITKGMK